jgi:hypothetical protein
MDKAALYLIYATVVAVSFFGLYLAHRAVGY